MPKPDFDDSTRWNGQGAYHRTAAPRQEDTVGFLWQGSPIPFLEEPELCSRLRGANVVRILDAGVGDGRNSLALERQGYFVIGVDIAPSAVELAAQRAICQNQNRAIFLVDDITTLTNVVGPVDAVLCTGTLGQLEDPMRAVANFSRILRPGGLLLFSVYSKLDGTYGLGHQIDEWRFMYKNCLFKYFDERRALDLVQGWENVSVKITSWLDPPHGDFRPEPHVHDCFVVLAQKPIVNRPGFTGGELI